MSSARYFCDVCTLSVGDKSKKRHLSSHSHKHLLELSQQQHLAEEQLSPQHECASPVDFYDAGDLISNMDSAEAFDEKQDEKSIEAEDLPHLDFLFERESQRSEFDITPVSEPETSSGCDVESDWELEPAADSESEPDERGGPFFPAHSREAIEFLLWLRTPPYISSRKANLLLTMLHRYLRLLMLHSS